MATRICRHTLRLVPHAPQWLSCDVCAADFPHRQDCPAYGSPQCLERCMSGAKPTDEEVLELLWLLPANERTDHA